MFSNPTSSAAVEFSPGFSPRPQITHVVFDFDGTLSWLRHGWPEIMYHLFRKHFPIGPGESEAIIHETLLDEILSLNGKPSIFQMQSFAERVQARGGECPTPEELLTVYQAELDQQISRRSHLILQGSARVNDFVIHGARAFLDKLQQRGLNLIILSGTIEHRVRQEAELLNLAHYFGPHIYGSKPDSSQWSKRMVLDRLVAEEKISPKNLLSFGDGPVEIFHTKELGGMAIAVASDEDHNGSGRMDPHKRKQLLSAGADMVIPDYRDPGMLLKIIFGR